jgi:hypothetical protein
MLVEDTVSTTPKFQPDVTPFGGAGSFSNTEKTRLVNHGHCQWIFPRCQQTGLSGLHLAAAELVGWNCCWASCLTLHCLTNAGKRQEGLTSQG